MTPLSRKETNRQITITEGQTTIAIDIDIAGAYQAFFTNGELPGTVRGISYLVPSTFAASVGVTMARTKVVMLMAVMAAAPQTAWTHARTSATQCGSAKFCCAIRLSPYLLRSIYRSTSLSSNRLRSIVFNDGGYREIASSQLGTSVLVSTTCSIYPP